MGTEFVLRERRSVNIPQIPLTSAGVQIGRHVAWQH